MPLTFPELQSASFFSHALVEPKRTFEVADLYFTSNPFHSLSNAVVPAVVLFSSVIGIGLIGLEDKERVLGPLRVLNDSIVRITKFIVGLTPFGVFAIGAVTAGTMTGETFTRLEVYFVAFAAASLLLVWLTSQAPPPPLADLAVLPFAASGATDPYLGTDFARLVAHNVEVVDVVPPRSVFQRWDSLDVRERTPTAVLAGVGSRRVVAGSIAQRGDSL